MRPVVAQDRAAAAARAVFAVAAVLVAVRAWENPLIALLLVVLPFGYLGVGLRTRPWKAARVWVTGLGEVPRADAVVVPKALAAARGLAIGSAGGVALLATTLIVERDTSAAGILLVPSAIVLARAVDRLLVTRAVRRWEGEQGVVLCRRRAPNRTGVELFHEADVERMVAVPVGR